MGEIKNVIQRYGIEVLNQGVRKILWKEDSPLFTPLERAEELYFFPLFDWLIDQRASLLEMKELKSFFYF